MNIKLRYSRIWVSGSLASEKEIHFKLIPYLEACNSDVLFRMIPADCGWLIAYNFMEDWLKTLKTLNEFINSYQGFQ